jgi:hypothetical protein
MFEIQTSPKSSGKFRQMDIKKGEIMGKSNHLSRRSPSSGQVLELMSIVGKAITAAIKNGARFERVREIIEKPGVVFEVFNDLLCPKEIPLLKWASTSDFVVEALDGKETIANGTEVFKFIDQNFFTWNLNKPSQPTKKTRFSTFDVIEDATFGEMFRFLSRKVNLNSCLTTQAQIKNICQKNLLELNDDVYSFLTENEDKEVVVISVTATGIGLQASLWRLEDGKIWFAKGRRKLIVPRLVTY